MLRRRSALIYSQASTVVRKRSATTTEVTGVPLNKRHAALNPG